MRIVTVTFVEEKAVSIEMPSSVVLTVTDAPEGIRGDSANNVQKAIIMETGHHRSGPACSSRPARRSKLILAPASTWNGRKALSSGFPLEFFGRKPYFFARAKQKWRAT